MRKVLIILAACLLVVGVAGFASADCVTCESDPGHIARGCEGEQSYCTPFDYEDFGSCSESMYSYCETAAKGAIHRALFKICDCVPPTGTAFSSIRVGDTIDISMQILVDKGNGAVTGDNGVYWAENVNSGYSNGIDMEPFSSQTDACNADCDAYTRKFVGEYIYKTAGGTVGTPLEGGTSCTVPDTNRVTSFGPAPAQTGSHGYTIQTTDVINAGTVWWINIPEMRVDPAKVSAGDKVFVQICLYNQPTTDLCTPANGCCCEVYIGQLCCENMDYECVYPYFAKANSTYWAFTGFALSNLSSSAGTATVTIYENDGDVGTMTISLDANGMYVNTIAGMTFTPAATNPGTLGDANFYMIVTADVPIHGFVMMGNPLTGESVGYIPDCNNFDR